MKNITQLFPVVFSMGYSQNAPVTLETGEFGST
jgi:hypothetical protein